MKRFVVWLIILFAFFGLADSAYLAKEAIAGDSLICNINGLSGCNIVAESPYSQILGIPLAYFGVVFYILLFILAAVEVIYVRVPVRRAIQALAVLGLIASAYFTFVQFSFINATCIYCMASAIISFLVFVLAYFIEPFVAEKRTPPTPLSPDKPPPPSLRLILPPPFS